MIRYYLGLGSNLGDRERLLADAAATFASHPSTISHRLSPVYESAPADGSDQPDYLNAVLELLSELDPWELLDLCQSIELAAGRKRTPGLHWEPRTLDVDILLAGQDVIETADLTIPHPGLCNRPFVVVPLADLNATLLHPVTGNRIGDLANDMKPTISPYQPIFT